jgi:Cu(I)/Ag(I) efflux system membrane fusion protein
MYAKVELEVPLGEALTVAESSVLRTGKQDLVFVDKGSGNMEIRRVELGHKTGGYYEVLRGLKEGEKVVSRANFLIDAESKIQAAIPTWDSEPDKATTSQESEPGKEFQLRGKREGEIRDDR